MRWAILAGTLAVGLAAGCSSGSDESRSTSSVAIETTSAPLETIAGGTEAQQALLEELVIAIGPEEIKQVEISDTVTNPYFAGAPPGVAIRALRTKESGVRGQWSTKLLAASFAERAPAEGLPCVEWGEASGDGSLLGCPDGELPGCQGLSGARAAELGARLGIELRTYEHLELGPNLDAFAVEFDVENGPRFLLDGIEDFEADVLGAVSGCHGAYVAVWDGQDEPVYRDWVVRSSNGNVSASTGVRDDLRGCWAPPMLGDEPPPPPPCPVD